MAATEQHLEPVFGSDAPGASRARAAVGAGVSDLLGTLRTLDRDQQRRWLIGTLIGVDAIALVAGLTMAGLLRARIDDVLPIAAFGWQDRHVVASLVAVFVLIGVFWIQGRYNVDECLVGTRDYAQTAHGVTYGVIVALALSYFSGGEPLVSRSWLLLAWAMSILCVGAGRFVTRRVVRHIRRRYGGLRTSVVIVGASTFAVTLAEHLCASEGEGIDVIGFLDEYLPLGEPLLPGIAVIGRPADLRAGAAAYAADEYIFVPQALPHERLEEITRLMASREGPVLRMAVSSRDLLTHGVWVTERGHVPLVTLQRARIRGLDVLFKRTLDIAGALLALMLVSPIALVALLWASKRGIHPLVVPQDIHAPGGGKTRLWLFAEPVSRRLPIRGAPALVAVLLGDLSLVGPRPSVWRDAAQPPRGLWLTALPPGLTGPWRLSGPEATIEQQMLQDLGYVRNYSIWEDLRILWRSAQPGTLLGRWQVARPLPAGSTPLSSAGRPPPRGAVSEIPATGPGSHTSSQRELVATREVDQHGR
jgi:lipopolysaccharide/colanic/teichoic acid biosynthesis glycosyltransferase